MFCIAADVGLSKQIGRRDKIANLFNWIIVGEDLIPIYGVARESCI